ncbi:FAD-dependent oxidoreductase [Streptomyces zhihengii]
MVVGGGLLGCLTAWIAARDGARVLLADKDQVNQHASGQNAGSLHFQLEYRMVEAAPRPPASPPRRCPCTSTPRPGGRGWRTRSGNRSGCAAPAG